LKNLRILHKNKIIARKIGLIFEEINQSIEHTFKKINAPDA